MKEYEGKYMAVKIELEINDSDQLVDAIIDISMLAIERNDKNLRDENREYSRFAINNLSTLFIKHHKDFSDRDFLLLKRFLYKINKYDPFEDVSDEFIDRCEKVNYKIPRDFDKSGNLIPDPSF